MTLDTPSFMTPPEPLAGARICLIFEHSLSHYTRLLQEIEALRDAGAEVRLLTSHPNFAEAPAGIERTWAALDGQDILARPIMPWPRLRALDKLLRKGIRFTIRGFSRRRAERARVAALEKLAETVDLFWVIDYPSLPTASLVARRTGTKLLYETVDLVPEYRYGGKRHRKRALADERNLLPHVDGFVTASDSYADYYVERYGDSVLSRRPVVRDNMPDEIATSAQPVLRPLRVLFLGSLMFDRPVVELIRAISLTAADVTLTLQGKNYLGDAPVALIAGLGISSKVRILDPCPPEAIVATASAYDVGIVALRGMDENERRASTAKLFTYMAAGLAILGSDLPGISRLVDEHQNGLLVGGMEPTDWAAAIDRMALLPDSDIEAMKRRSIDAARRYAWETQRPAYIAEFRRALGTTRLEDI